MPFAPGFREIEPNELVRYLLRVSGQDEQDAVNPVPILDVLGISHLSLNFRSELPEVVEGTADCPRALLSFPDRIIATAHDLDEKRARFSTFHEIGHYVLPQHVEELVLCTDTDMSYHAQRQREQEANAFAAHLLFHGDRFQLEANAHAITATTVKVLADRYCASYEATARQLVEANLRPYMLITYAKAKSDRNIDLSFLPTWYLQYTVSSPAFAIRYFDTVLDTGDTFVKIALDECTDIGQSITTKLTLALLDGGQGRFRAEYFHNFYKVFCLLSPLGEESA